MNIRNIILPILLFVSLMLSGCAYQGYYDWNGEYDYAPYEYYGGYGFYGYSPYYYGGEAERGHHEFSRGAHGEHHEFHEFNRGERGEGHEFHGGEHGNHDFRK